jgi:class 3 adenylate cyclase
VSTPPYLVEKILQSRTALEGDRKQVTVLFADLKGSMELLAARMEQMAMPGSVLITAEVLRLAEGYVQVDPLGPVPIKGLPAPAEVHEVTGASARCMPKSAGRSKRTRRCLWRSRCTAPWR